MIGSLTSQKRDLFPLDSFFFFSSVSFLYSHQIECYMSTRNPIFTLFLLLFFLSMPHSRPFAMICLRALPSFLLLYKNANKREKGESEQAREREREWVRENWVSPIWIFSRCKKRAFYWKCSLSIVYFLLLFISFLSIKLILTFLSKWYFH